MKFLAYLFFIYCLSLSTVQAKEIYMWLDGEDIKQFSYTPPPASCQTPSCIQLHKKITRKLQQRKEAELGRLEAERLQQQEIEQKRKQQQETVKQTPTSDLSQKTFLPIATVLCVSFNNIKEYHQVRQARKYLERDQVCTKTNEETEYTIIERQEDFSNIRIYLVDGSSQKKWVESRYLFDKQ